MFSKKTSQVGSTDQDHNRDLEGQIFNTLLKSLEACSVERQTFETAKLAKEKTSGVIGETRKRVQSLEAESERLRLEIAELAGRGLNITDKVRERAKLLAELAVQSDLADDLEKTGLSAVESEINRTREVWQKAAMAALHDVSRQYQEQANLWFAEIARLFVAYFSDYNKLIDSDPELSALPYRYGLYWSRDMPEKRN